MDRTGLEHRKKLKLLSRLKKIYIGFMKDFKMLPYD